MTRLYLFFPNDWGWKSRYDYLSDRQGLYKKILPNERWDIRFRQCSCGQPVATVDFRNEWYERFLEGALGPGRLPFNFLGVAFEGLTYRTCRQCKTRWRLCVAPGCDRWFVDAIGPWVTGRPIRDCVRCAECRKERRKYNEKFGHTKWRLAKELGVTTQEVPKGLAELKQLTIDLKSAARKKEKVTLKNPAHERTHSKTSGQTSLQPVGATSTTLGRVGGTGKRHYQPAQSHGNQRPGKRLPKVRKPRNYLRLTAR